MKSKKIIYLEKMLRLMAIVVLKRHKPKIVGITGSVGKSFAKEAVYLALNKKYNVRKNIENYNNEIGIPLTIIGAKTGGKNPLRWLLVFMKWLGWLISPIGYPKILILEMAVDHPGDMKYLTNFIPVDIAVLTNISLSHLKFFKNIDEIAQEKISLAKAVEKRGTIILNIDNSFLNKYYEKINKYATAISMQKNADVIASDVHFNYIDEELRGLSFKLNFQGKIIPFRLPNIIAEHQIYAILVAIAVANHFKINLIEVAKLLEDFQSPPRRMNLVYGVNNSLVIDDSYNSSPISTVAALKTFCSLRAKRRIAILGDMLELGKKTEGEHQKIIRNILEDDNIHILITIGKRMKKAMQIISSQKKVTKTVLSFDNAQKMLDNINGKIRIVEGDLVLVKGSRAMQMEKIVEKIIKK
ncbi:MAG TPA: UDP-N-acetylmuramoyl-tripeptide--D-alanyl-D-alanine ligase [Candidatus Moranbacteria bacterium]|nr:UDP-N-acetylmuramoyl-tripeptide--D-alanyl-D-alanine ligase [Candidatus Moranbacteria bacterium]